MPLLAILAVLIVVGVLVWAAESLPLSAPFKTLIRVVAVVAVVLWLVSLVTGFDPLAIRVGGVS